MLKVYVLDLCFNWPPDSGARIDTYYLLRYLAGVHDVELVTVRMKDRFPRGRLPSCFPFAVSHVEIPDEVTHHAEFCDRVLDHLERRRPDVLIIAMSSKA
ncbi:MAG: hypothetical protein IH897_05605 [Planctomycetes bacterium]|nr:hypothetical protein [Planctomycetota bacterium]